MSGIRECLPELIERVESGVGVDRVIDGAIYDFFSTGLSVSAEHIVLHTSPDPNWLPHYTSSLDTVVSLIEQKLPLAEWEVTTTGFKPGATVIPNGSKHGGAYAPSPARALLAAFLRALQEARTLADANQNQPDEAEHG